MTARTAPRRTQRAREPGGVKAGLSSPERAPSRPAGSDAPTGNVAQPIRGVIRNPPRYASLRERLTSRLRLDPHTGCLIWTGTATPRGYGSISSAEMTYATHRLAWEFAHGDISDGMHVLHRCDTPRCCNVDHMFLGTQADNMADKVAKGRQAKGFRGFTDAQLAECVALRNSGASWVDLSARYGRSKRTLQRIVEKAGS